MLGDNRLEMEGGGAVVEVPPAGVRGDIGQGLGSIGSPAPEPPTGGKPFEGSGYAAVGGARKGASATRACRRRCGPSSAARGRLPEEPARYGARRPGYGAREERHGVSAAQIGSADGEIGCLSCRDTGYAGRDRVSWLPRYGVSAIEIRGAEAEIRYLGSRDRVSRRSRYGVSPGAHGSSVGETSFSGRERRDFVPITACLTPWAAVDCRQSEVPSSRRPGGPADSLKRPECEC